MLELEQVSLQRAGKRLLWQVSLQAVPGELCVILGPNGAGKSTLLQVMSGYLRPDSGRVRLGGQDTVGLSAARLASLRAVVEQQATVPSGWRVSELVAAGSYFAAPGQQAAAMAQALTLTDTSRLAQRRLDSLSGGEVQRAHLARALCQLLASTQPERYLLLDEATAALDFAIADSQMAQWRQLAQDLHIGVVAVVHDLNLALRHADRVLLLQDGCSIAFGRTADIMQQARLEAIYGIRLAELISPDAGIRAFVPHTPR